MTRSLLVTCDGPGCEQRWQEDERGAPALSAGPVPVERIQASFDGRRTLDFCSRDCLNRWHARDLEERTALHNRWSRTQRCGNPFCHAPVQQGGLSWRWTGAYWEHACPVEAQHAALTGQAPTFSARETAGDETVCWWAAETLPVAEAIRPTRVTPSRDEQRAWLEREQERLGNL